MGAAKGRQGGDRTVGSPTVPETRGFSYAEVLPSVALTYPTDWFTWLCLQTRIVVGDGIQQPDALLPTTGWVTSGGPATANPVTYPSHSRLYFSRAVTTIELDKTSEQNTSGDVMADQIRGAAASLYRLVASSIWADSAPANAPSGMAAFALQNPAGLLDVNGLPTLDLFGCMGNLQEPSLPTSPIYFVMHPKVFNYTLSLLRGRGGQAEWVHDERIGGRVPLINGFKFVKNSNIGFTGAGGTTRIYCVRAGRGPHDPEIVDGVEFCQPVRGVQVGPRVEDSANPDVVSCTLSIDILLKRGMITAVNCAQGVTEPPG
jgi:hypothetical protein